MSSDFTFNFNDDEQVPKKIHLHKIILMVYSDYFNKYFTTALVKDKSQSALNFWVFDSYDLFIHNNVFDFWDLLIHEGILDI